jgi:L-iditol 2-dehydrogenase
MKTALLTGIRELEIREVPMPRLVSDTDVLIRIGATGICGSDVHYYLSGRIGGAHAEHPFTVGHEAAGTVLEIGSRVTRLAPGDRVALEPAISCGSCDQCRAGRPNTCRHLSFLGFPGQAPGCLSEYVVVPERNCFRIAESTRLEQAALAEPVSIALYAVRNSIPMAGACIAVLGTGPIGLGVVMVAREGGAARIYATDEVPDRRAAARTAGADYVGDPTREEVVEAILDREPRELDAVFECCGEQDALDQGLQLLEPGGKLVIVGIPEARRISFDPDLLRRKEITAYYVRREINCVRPALDLIESGRIDVDFLVTHRFPLDRAEEAFDLLADYRDGVIKAMVCAP